MAVCVCWSVKGGTGTTVVAAALALSADADAAIVDLDGDVPAVLGIAEPTGQGIADWLESDAPAAAIADLAVEVDATTVLIPRGRAALDAASSRWAELRDWLLTRPAAVVDAGRGPPPPDLVGRGVESLLVVRACFLALRRAAALPERPDGVVLVAEPGRSLARAEVGRAVGAPVIASVSVDPAVARAVDAGLLAARLPRPIQRELRRVGGRGTRARPVRRARAVVAR